MGEKVALFDMDSTLCDFEGAMRRDLEKLSSPQEHPRYCFDEAIPHVGARRDLIKRQPGWWLRLEPLPRGFEVLKMCQEIGFTIHILTKGPHKTTPAWSEKVEWCRQHLPGIPVTITEDKGLVYGRVLVDDWPDYITRWLDFRPRGQVIVPAHEWNATLAHANITRFDGTNQQRVRRVLQDSFNR